jgi:RsiW-degrading membrane proteinase PrsW (M82 family)
MKNKKKYNKWTIILTSVLIVIGIYILKTEGKSELIDIIIKAIFLTLFAGLFLKQYLKRAKR